MHGVIMVIKLTMPCRNVVVLGYYRHNKLTMHNRLKLITN